MSIRCPWPLVSSAVVYPHKSNRQVGDHIRDSIEHLLRRYLVDVTISGHVHSYYRTCPVFDERCTDTDADTDGAAANSAAAASSSISSHGPAPVGAKPGGIFGVEGGSSGDGSHGVVHLVVGSAGHKLSSMEEGQEEWVAAAERVWGYTRFTVAGGDKMSAEFVESETGAVLDAFEVAPSAERRRLACPAAAVARTAPAS